MMKSLHKILIVKASFDALPILPVGVHHLKGERYSPKAKQPVKHTRKSSQDEVQVLCERENAQKPVTIPTVISVSLGTFQPLTNLTFLSNQKFLRTVKQSIAYQIATHSKAYVNEMSLKPNNTCNQ
jgi:hypothetical protein